jgi:glucan phosphoethanolaminetransferase (alkaline phosphatase superfamily)
MTNKTLAIVGIVSYILSVITSAENLEGNYIAPIPLIILSGILTTLFIVMATIRLWRKANHISIILASSAITLFLLTIIQEVTLPAYGSPIIILLNVSKVIYFIATLGAIVKLFKAK